MNSIEQSSETRLTDFCNGKLGFAPDKNKKAWINIRKVTENMSLNECHSHSSNMKCHNLCTTTPPPTNMAKLLGLGSKFCLQSRKLNKSYFDNVITRFKHDIRVK